jgi:hypothetical protein
MLPRTRREIGPSCALAPRLIHSSRTDGATRRPQLQGCLALTCLSICVAALGCGHGALGSSTTRFAHASSDRYVEALVARARAENLAGQTQWLRLGHYRLGMMGRGFLGGGYASEADDPGFFLSPTGKIDPEAELEATLRAFFLPPPAADEAAPDSRTDERGVDAHALCRFPARFMYLTQALAIDPAHLPVQHCPRAETFFGELDPSSVTLIFSAYYLNNPASAFGHTFLRLNKRNSLAIGERRELLDYGIDYSADVDTGNALLYAFKGLLGLFPGTFKRLPYYYKVRAYNDYEARDLWEYELALQPAQLAMLMAHLWELGHTYFAYYYLSENCSYHILALLEAADPALHLLDDIHSPVIPADTVKALFETPGLVRRTAFRPSLRRQFNERVRNLDEAQKSAVEALAVDPEYALPASWEPARVIETLDAAADLIDVLYARDLVHKDNAPAARRKQRLLERRAKILQPSAPVVVEPPLREAPERGHGSRRFGLGVASQAGQFAPTLEFRLALHDLADSTPGYPELSAIEFLRGRLQFWQPLRFELDDASIVRVTSLSPQTRFERKMSWEFDLGASTLWDKACVHCLAPHVAGGGGLAFSFFEQGLTVFALLHGVLAYSPQIGGLLDSHVRIGIGPSGGLRLRLAPNLIAFAVGNWHWLPDQHPSSTYRVDATLRWQCLDEFALGLEGRKSPSALEGQLLGFVYF